MALPRFAKLPAERRRRLLAAAAIEFAEKGYTGAVLSAIADRSGIGKSSFYYYFADKADLYSTVLEAAWKRLAAGVRIDLNVLTAETFWSAIEQLAGQNLELCSREPWLLAASKMLNQVSPDPAGQEILEPYLQQRRAWETAWIARGQELGAIRGDVPADLLVEVSLSAWQASNRWQLERIPEVGLEEAHRVAITSLAIHRAMLSPESTRSTGDRLSVHFEAPFEDPQSADSEA